MIQNGHTNMTYYSVNDRTFQKGDLVYVVACGNPDYEIESRKQIISADSETASDISATAKPIEEVVTEQGELRESYK